MTNYLINEAQLFKVVKQLKESHISSGDAMRKIVEVLKNKGWEPEQIIDFIIGLRTKDEFTKAVSKQFNDDPEYDLAVDRMLSVED